MSIWQVTAFQDPDAVAEESKRSLRGDSRIELTQRTCRRVTRVCKHFPTGTTRFFVDLLEARLWKEYFPAHFQPGGNVIATQFQRDRTNSAHISGDVFPGSAVAARCGTHHHAVLIKNANGQTIQL
ncbi:Uncharacterised protein [Enterobacter cloacae]|nr:Uncharacterised protein [Enterobacter cloacae]